MIPGGTPFSQLQRCPGRYGRIHRFGCTSIYDKNMQEGHLDKQQQSTHSDKVLERKPSTDSVKGAEEGSGEVTQTAPAPEQQMKRCRVDDGFGETQQKAPTPEPVCKPRKRGGFRC